MLKRTPSEIHYTNFFGIGLETKIPYTRRLIENIGRRRLSGSLVILKAAPSTITAIAQSDDQIPSDLLEKMCSSSYP